MILHLHTPLDLARWLQASGARDLQGDSRRVRPGDAFVAWPGSRQDARHFVAQALKDGALACVVEREGVEAFGFRDDRIAAVSDLKVLAGEIANHFYREPSHGIDVVAVTGTNGKTSTAWWAAQWLSALGYRAEVVGTLGMGPPGHTLEDTGLTTPDPMRFQARLRHLRDQGARACVVEASSIGIEEHRLAGTRIRTAVFTNLSQDHLDYHGSMERYWSAKRALFDWPGLQAAVVNVDDARGAELVEELRPQADAGNLDLWTVSTSGRPARLRIPEWTMTDTGMRFRVIETGTAGAEGAGHQVKLALTGDYNLSNLLCALAVVRAHGYALASALTASARLTPVPGRLQAVWREGPHTASDFLPHALVDYAHTPDALEKALRAVQPLALQRGGRLWCVVGCGGERDAGKRPLMAAVAEREAARVVLTSDNPRGEDPAAILMQMRKGLVRPDDALVEPDRAAAIAHAVAQADERDVVLIAGKGHERYQEVAGVRHPFSDLDEAQRALQRRWDTAREARA